MKAREGYVFFDERSKKWVARFSPFVNATVVLQKMNRDVRNPSYTPIYAAIPKRFDTNLTCL